ncbi:MULTISPECIES: DUF72 domain-containing protein [unclassified Actinopolyspora]|uniref:DUF72 domain-containing protein n=1 Tax=unclassified Actinopolyspora TaxID=2639451 RepID=UPI0013F693E4|nr:MULTISPECIES: DUF72 domain-containing protein [unclassified Actinopolyspora]NHD16844.1 DUF72 domain-containing protein [Actinopolyspora sp. BKK2]NHE75996.1 DUF72 domain-containing protein [Actinopolyspora sp. BKK1]
MGEILVGTAGWTDRGLLQSGWYPPGTDTPARRLAHYAERFPLVEVDSTYYHPPSERTAELWVRRTPGDFTFNVKAFRLFTRHPAKPSTLPRNLRWAAGSRRDNVSLDELDPDVVEELWRRFRTALAPLYEAGKLGVVLFQFPPWFSSGPDNRRYLVECRDRAAPLPVCVEFRNHTWMEEHERERTLDFLSQHRLPCVVVDSPRGHGNSIPPVIASTADPAVVRFHGRSTEWNSRIKERRFGYKYSEEELAAWVPALRELSASVSTTYVVLNNCYRDYAHVNAAQLVELLDGAGRER